MHSYEILKDLAIILVSAKVCGLVARKLKAPQVVGQIIAGLLVGPCLLGVVQQSDFITQMAEIGVILVMFSAGLGTNLKDLIKTGPIALVIACAGVFVPLVGGTVLYLAIYGMSPWGSEEFFRAVFIGTIMTATSVSITVASLQEMGKLKGKIGTTILSAAIIDDVIGIIVLTFVLGFKDPASKPAMVIVDTGLFLLLSVIGGYITYKIFKKVDRRYPHTRRIPIAGVAYCFAMAYIAETYFGIADITGAYVAGITLCNIDDCSYIEEKVDINTYIIFGPLFFAGIGLKTDFSNMDSQLLVFSVAFVIVALMTKIVGCGLVGKVCGFSGVDSLKIGVGMMTRGEVALIIAQKGLSVGIISGDFFTAVILLIIVSSIATPVILKALYARTDKTEAELTVAEA